MLRGLSWDETLLTPNSAKTTIKTRFFSIKNVASVLMHATVITDSQNKERSSDHPIVIVACVPLIFCVKAKYNNSDVLSSFE